MEGRQKRGEAQDGGMRQGQGCRLPSKRGEARMGCNFGKRMTIFHKVWPCLTRFSGDRAMPDFKESLAMPANIVW